jgi:hypothetical protein
MMRGFAQAGGAVQGAFDDIFGGMMPQLSADGMVLSVGIGRRAAAAAASTFGPMSGEFGTFGGVLGGQFAMSAATGGSGRPAPGGPLTRAPVSDTAGKATFTVERIRGQKLPHYTVETEFRGVRLPTEQVVVDEETGSTTIRETLRFQKIIQQGQIDLPDAQAAQAYQESVLRTDTGTYNYYRNSCVTHVVNVLNAGGLNLPTSTRLARAALQGLLGE